ncbi:MAG: AAA family ATPase [Nitrospirales bacterium]|nr:ParA family protein [Nitrospira sp.]MDR4500902.1 AAA family ATPase [Nitrospirales bacterium]
MKKIIAVANQKGGVGKTTTAINVCASIAHTRRSVLFIDLDPQANATSGMGIQAPKCTIYDCLMARDFIDGAVIETMISGLDMIPASSDLVGAEVELSHVPGREEVLKTILGKIRRDYEWVIIDCPPALGLLTINALVAASSVLIPVQCEYYAMEGLGRLLGNVDRIKESINPRLELEGIVLTMHDSRINLSRQVEKEIREYFEGKVYKTVIPRNVSLAECPSYGKPVLLYNAASSGSRAYLDLAEEIIA